MSSTIVLLGLPGAGKTYWGKKIAAEMQLPFYDLDQLIEKQSGLHIHEIFAEGGEILFRSIEKSMLYELSLSKGTDNYVLALGGGTPAFHNNMRLINELGKSIYLNVSLDTILHNLEQDELNIRPLIKNEKPEKVKAYLQNLLKEREPYYLMADYMMYEEELNLSNFLKIINDQHD